ncbi:MAG: copper chaperone PCu(A)C [Rhizobiales bacterium]|nr:copper chaperone PCu(A)C [Hyphomicrobiales bacterium]
MHHILTKRSLLGGALALTVALGTGAAAQAQDQSQPVKAGDLVISNAWTRATPGGAKVGGGYLTIENKGTTADKLVGGTTTVAGKLEVHQMSMSDGVMKMHPVEGGLTIEPGKTVKLAPGGYHLMMVDLKQPFKQGETVPVTLQFEKAGKVAVSLSVQGIGASAPGAGGGAMMMMKKDPDHSQHGAGK